MVDDVAMMIDDDYDDVTIDDNDVGEVRGDIRD